MDEYNCKYERLLGGIEQNMKTVVEGIEEIKATMIVFSEFKIRTDERLQSGVQVFAEIRSDLNDLKTKTPITISGIAKYCGWAAVFAGFLFTVIEIAKFIKS